MKNPFESGHIKNYLLLYASVVVIMILFFIASSLFNDVEDIEKKIFNTEIKEKVMNGDLEAEVNASSRFKLLDKAY
ncbi:MAG: hypothetical protein DRG78_19945 [Epsilonproteobacteria bacterium]|nr:MAG: hypothetical protein DRG78_19945 [Campylobacterota bacterium]